MSTTTTEPATEPVDLPDFTLDTATDYYEAWPPAPGQRAEFVSDDEGSEFVVRMPDGTEQTMTGPQLGGDVVILMDAGPDQGLPSDEVWHLAWVRDGEGRSFCAWSSELL